MGIAIDITILYMYEELLGIFSLWEKNSRISRKGISKGGCRNPEGTLQYLGEPALDTSGSRPSPTQSRLDDSVSGSQGTRGLRDRSLITVASISLTILRQTGDSRR